MSVIGSIISAIANGLVNGTAMLVNTIVQGIISGVQMIISGFQNMIGIPANLWETNVSTNGISIPIIFTIVLGVAILLALAFIDALGLETEVGEDFMVLEDL